MRAMPHLREVAGCHRHHRPQQAGSSLKCGLLREAEGEGAAHAGKLRRGFGSTEGEAANDEHGRIPTTSGGRACPTGWQRLSAHRNGGAANRSRIGIRSKSCAGCAGAWCMV